LRSSPGQSEELRELYHYKVSGGGVRGSEIIRDENIT